MLLMQPSAFTKPRTYAMDGAILTVGEELRITTATDVSEDADDAAVERVEDVSEDGAATNSEASTEIGDISYTRTFRPLEVRKQRS